LVCGALSWGIVRIRRVNAHLLQNNKFDSLTGLLNRGYFNDHILTRQADRPYVGCLLLMGLDCLEHINEAVGYCAGDEALSIVSKRLTRTMRDSDALVRWGGETFLVMTGPMSDSELNNAVRRLLTDIHNEPITWNDVSIECKVSIGYASFPVNGAAVDISVDGAITLVGKALQQARGQGGDRASLITAVNANNAQELGAISAQFKVAASDGRVKLVEAVGALVRGASADIAAECEL
jgi:diguanylate cyclase (GGDEF)-like protein